jgi:hypothetical protein
MNRRSSWMLMIGTLFSAAMWVSSSAAQGVNQPTDHKTGCTALISSDVSVTGSFWTPWGAGLFSTFQFHSWGNAPARSWPSRTSVAVLRERRGLMR